MAGGGYLRPGEQVTGLPPGMNNDFLTAPIEGAHLADGDIVPTVSSTYGARPSGLLVPMEYARPPVPLDSVATYLTSAEVFGATIPAEVTVDHLRRLPLLEVVDFCSELLGLVDRPGYSQDQVDAMVLNRLTPAYRRRVMALLAGGERVLVAPHVLLMLIKYAAQCSGDCMLPHVERGQVLAALFGTGDDLERLGADENGGDADDDLVVGTGVPGRIEREVVAIHHFHRQTEPQHVLARFIRRWTQLPIELTDDPEVVDLPAEFRAAVGVCLDDFIAVGVLLHSVAISRGPRVPRDAVAQLDLADDTVAERILALVAQTPAELRAWARDPDLISPWEFSHLEQFPVIDCGEHLLAIRPDLILQRFFGWMPLFDVGAALGADKDARSQRSRIQGCVEHLSEIYARETLQVQARRHHLRLFAEAELRAALSPGQGRKTSDLTVDDGRRWAVFEVTSSRLTRASVASTSAAELDQDFDKLLKKVRQLDATISSLRLREAALTGQAVSSVPRRYFPVLVLAEGFPVNPITTTMLRQRTAEAGLLTSDDTNELEVVDGTELEIIEGAAFGEITVLDALEAKAGSTLSRANMRDFLLRDHQLRTRTPHRVEQLAHVAYEIAERAASRPPATGAA